MILAILVVPDIFTQWISRVLFLALTTWVQNIPIAFLVELTYWPKTENFPIYQKVYIKIISKKCSPYLIVYIIIFWFSVISLKKSVRKDACVAVPGRKDGCEWPGVIESAAEWSKQGSFIYRKLLILYPDSWGKTQMKTIFKRLSTQVIQNGMR